MDEMIYEISGSFNETDKEMYGTITVDGVTTAHRIDKRSTADARAALLIMVADALGYETAEVINFDSLEINDNWASEEE